MDDVWLSLFDECDVAVVVLDCAITIYPDFLADIVIHIYLIDYLHEFHTKHLSAKYSTVEEENYIY